jgi:hypothetical protein
MANSFEARTLKNKKLYIFLEKHSPYRSNFKHKWNVNLLALVAFYYRSDLKEIKEEIRIENQKIKAVPGILSAFSLQDILGHYQPTNLYPNPWSLNTGIQMKLNVWGNQNAKSKLIIRKWKMLWIQLEYKLWKIRESISTDLLKTFFYKKELQILNRENNIFHLINFESQNMIFDNRYRLSEKIQQEKFFIKNEVVQEKLQLCVDQLGKVLAIPESEILKMHFKYNRDYSKPLNPAILFPFKQMQMYALTQRFDILEAAQQFNEVQDELQIAIDEQYPAIHIAPGYLWDAQGDKWLFGLGLSLPFLNHAHSRIMEMQFKRKQTAEKLMALQEKIISNLKETWNRYQYAYQIWKKSKNIFNFEKKRYRIFQKFKKGGKAFQLAKLNYQLKYFKYQLYENQKLYALNQALLKLERVLQIPIFKSSKSLWNKEVESFMVSWRTNEN